MSVVSYIQAITDGLREEMHRDLLAFGAPTPISVERVDIDCDADLAARYGHKVPVLVWVHGGQSRIGYSAST